MPRLAVNMMVVNGEQILRRCLMPLKGVIDELVVIDTGSTDKTRQVLNEISSDLNLARYYYEVLDTSSASDDFFPDLQDSWHFPMSGPFTGLPIPMDWARIRNLLLERTTADYILKLDADDEPICPSENWLRTVAHLDTSPHIALVAAPYEIYDGQGNYFWLSMYDRLWRRESDLRWSQVCHEYLQGKTAENTLLVPSGLRVRDWRDSPGQGARIAHRNLKVLLYDHELFHRGASMEMDTAEFVRRFTLAHEAVGVLPDLASELLEGCVQHLWLAGSPDVSPDRAMLSDCHYHLGRLAEHECDVDTAEKQYARADRFNPHLQALVKRFLLLAEHVPAHVCKEEQENILLKIGNGVPYNCDLLLLEKVRAWKG